MRDGNSRRYDHNRIHVVKIRVGLWHEELHVERPVIGEKLVNGHCFDFFGYMYVFHEPTQCSLQRRVMVGGEPQSKGTHKEMGVLCLLLCGFAVLTRLALCARVGPTLRGI